MPVHQLGAGSRRVDHHQGHAYDQVLDSAGGTGVGEKRTNNWGNMLESVATSPYRGYTSGVPYEASRQYGSTSVDEGERAQSCL